MYKCFYLFHDWKTVLYSLDFPTLLIDILKGNDLCGESLLFTMQIVTFCWGVAMCLIFKWLCVGCVRVRIAVFQKVGTVVI